MPTVLSLICRLAEVEKSDDDAAAAIQKEVDEAMATPRFTPNLVEILLDESAPVEIRTCAGKTLKKACKLHWHASDGKGIPQVDKVVVCNNLFPALCVSTEKKPRKKICKAMAEISNGDPDWFYADGIAVAQHVLEGITSDTLPGLSAGMHIFLQITKTHPQMTEETRKEHFNPIFSSVLPHLHKVVVEGIDELTADALFHSKLALKSVHATSECGFSEVAPVFDEWVASLSRVFEINESAAPDTRAKNKVWKLKKWGWRLLTVGLSWCSAQDHCSTQFSSSQGVPTMELACQCVIEIGATPTPDKVFAEYVNHLVAALSPSLRWDLCRNTVTQKLPDLLPTLYPHLALPPSDRKLWDKSPEAFAHNASHPDASRVPPFVREFFRRALELSEHSHPSAVKDFLMRKLDASNCGGDEGSPSMNIEIDLSLVLAVGIDRAGFVDKCLLKTLVTPALAHDDKVVRWLACRIIAEAQLLNEDSESIKTALAGVSQCLDDPEFPVREISAVALTMALSRRLTHDVASFQPVAAKMGAILESQQDVLDRLSSLFPKEGMNKSPIAPETCP